MKNKIPVKTELIAIDKDQVLTEAMVLMEKKNISHLLVRDEGEIVGIITERDIADKFANFRDLKTERKLKSEQFHVSSAMNKNLKTIPFDAKITDAAKLMIENGISSLPVVENNKITGIVTKTDLIKEVNQSGKEVAGFYSKVPVTITLGSSIVSARKVMLNHGIHRILVTDEKGEKLLGILSERAVASALRDFRSALDKYKHADVRKLKVDDYMKRDPITINPDVTVSEAAEIMCEKSISGLPVVDDTLGILTKTDIVRGISEGTLP